MRNVEIKAKVQNLAALLNKARLLSKSEGVSIKQCDTFFNVDQGRLKLRKFENGESELIFYERTDGEGPKLSSYEKCSINAPETDNLHRVLTRALGNNGIVKKTRHLFMVEQTRVHVDTVEDLGTFVELEVVLDSNQTVEEGETIAASLMKELGINKDDLLSGAYRDMLKK
ncbi:hypothetical protein FQR65_LT04361 [Abscondita terminalis]|nr:hypothetical protein FQR65_LT04361 [Abscondita terminalis]